MARRKGQKLTKSTVKRTGINAAKAVPGTQEVDMPKAGNKNCSWMVKEAEKNFQDARPMQQQKRSRSQPS